MPFFFGLLCREKVYAVKENSLVNNRAGKNFQASFSPSLLYSSPHLLPLGCILYYLLLPSFEKGSKQFMYAISPTLNNKKRVYSSVHHP
jgi:hypothetical protein